MSPSTAPNRKPRNLAARMGRWSANHWKTATFGWLALVIVAFGLGGMVGTKNPDPNTAGPGESGRMDRILHEGFKRPAAENVLIQSTTATAGTPAFNGAVNDVVARVSREADVRNVRSPLAPAIRTRSRRIGTRPSSASTSAVRSTRRRTRSTPSSAPSQRPRPPIPASSSARWATPVPRRPSSTSTARISARPGRSPCRSR